MRERFFIVCSRTHRAVSSVRALRRSRRPERETACQASIPLGRHPSPLRVPQKKRREAGEVASRRAGANTGNCSQLHCNQQSLCQTTKPFKNKLLWFAGRGSVGDV